jgi:hypothetical protein
MSAPMHCRLIWALKYWGRLAGLADFAKRQMYLCTPHLSRIKTP